LFFNSVSFFFLRFFHILDGFLFNVVYFCPEFILSLY
jgi:hypothetical protein